MTNLKWNAGGWFGAQLGSSVWILLAGVLSFRRDAGAGALVIGLFLAFNLLGLWLWSRRDRLPVWRGLRSLLVALAITSCAAVFALDRVGLWEDVQIGNGVVTPASLTYGIILVMVIALLVFLRPRHDDEEA